MRLAFCGIEAQSHGPAPALLEVDGERAGRLHEALGAHLLLLVAILCIRQREPAAAFHA